MPMGGFWHGMDSQNHSHKCSESNSRYLGKYPQNQFKASELDVIAAHLTAVHVSHFLAKWQPVPYNFFHIPLSHRLSVSLNSRPKTFRLVSYIYIIRYSMTLNTRFINNWILQQVGMDSNLLAKKPIISWNRCRFPLCEQAGKGNHSVVWLGLFIFNSSALLEKGYCSGTSSLFFNALGTGCDLWGSHWVQGFVWVCCCYELWWRM